MTHKLLAMVFLVSTAILGCTSVPKGLEPVSEFNGDRYMGKWYEIARFDHSFEKNLSNVSAIYSLKENGEISLINRGYNEKTGEWKQIEGKARFMGEETVGSLKVSFFGPFYGGYHIIALDKENYSYAMVSGPSRSYLWILSRTTSLNEDIYSRLIDKAAKMGFDTIELINVKHDRSAKHRKLEGKAKLVSKPETILTPCPKTPNCVSTLAEDKRHYIEPITYKGDRVDAQYEILGILDSMKGYRVATVEGLYIQAEFVSSVFRFVDDVEFYFDDAKKMIQMKSASRIGYSDWGVNRRRIEEIRKRFEKDVIGRYAGNLNIKASFKRYSQDQWQ